jgi:hypothetical protein
MENCKGCNTKARCLCIRIKFVIGTRCPCEICLVKPMCNTICDIRRGFSDKIFSSLFKILRTAEDSNDCNKKL